MPQAGTQRTLVRWRFTFVATRIAAASVRDPTSLAEVVNQAGQLTRRAVYIGDPASLAEVVNQAGRLRAPVRAVR